MLNLFLGWTFVGWVIALVWALSKDTKRAIQVINKPTTSLNKPDALLKLAELKEKGILSEDEFMKEKNKILNS